MKSFICGGVWTGPGDSLLPPSVISISGDRIEKISSYDTNSNMFVIPAFVDAHCHFTWTGLERLYMDLSGVVSAADLLESVNSEIDSTRTGSILRGFGFEENNWSDPVLPSLRELDRATGNRPVILRRVCGHEALLNSAMLELLPPESSGVDYSRGILREGIIFDLGNLFPPEPHILRNAFASAVELSYSSGVTAVHTFESIISAEALLAARSQFRMSISIFGKDAGFLRKLPEGLEEILASIDGLKFFLDGSLGAFTAAVSGNYSNGSIAEPILSDEQVMRSLELSESLDLVPVYHAIGGRALTQIDRVSNSFINEHAERKSSKIRIEHAEELTVDWPGSWDPSVHTFVMQPNFVNRWQMPGGMYENVLGPERTIALNPFNLVKEAGFEMCFGSDGMPFGPLSGLSGATGHPLEKYRMDTSAALDAYTLGAASVCGFQDLSEHISHGRLADLTVLSADPFTVPWDDIEIVATLCEGQVVYGHLPFLEDT